MSVHGDEIDGREWSYLRGDNMSATAPPDEYRWHHSEMKVGHGNDVVKTDYETREEFIVRRLVWLEQYDLEVTVEGAYRYWRWYDLRSERRQVWWERRPVDSPYPTNLGLWPFDE